MWSMVQMMRVRVALSAFMAPRYTLPRHAAAMVPMTRSSSELGAPSLVQRLWHYFFGGSGPSDGLALAQVDALPLPTPAPSAPVWQWDGLLLAAPKKKVSHSRKAMRAANKGLKDRVDLVHCPGCHRPKPQHHLCEHCYGDLARSLKRSAAKVDP
ncbi:Similar to S.cerevisiae protein MRPL32 (Mitochondrial ribosomal protein of the large subunit) [Malassezia sympodialis ATCC 42132]|uniref:Large ribosomal subunit protein bL32m n=1 Tax=Malassezia sympodialis (strain ATCC 42132) TaxID=1230383 RepID=A0A1M8A9E9_MALS4|nr:Similar to S.cerevisiae protein MRPL32 (Mitochondrial ribosomal protein of the large subunit) [Malassezia sympodialis ATCC 42132]